MKLSVSIPDADLEFLDEYMKKFGVPTRSAAVQKAIRLLRTGELAEAYEAAYGEWTGSEDAELWDSTVGDGIE